MKDWFYLPNEEVVSKNSGTTKSKVVLAVRRGYQSVDTLQDYLGIQFATDEIEDAKALVHIYAPTSYENMSGCKGCDGCSADKPIS